MEYNWNYKLEEDRRLSCYCGKSPLRRLPCIELEKMKAKT